MINVHVNVKAKIAHLLMKDNNRQKTQRAASKLPHNEMK